MEDEIAIVFERTEEGYSRRDIGKRRNKEIEILKKERDEFKKKLKKANSEYDKSQKRHAQSLVKLVALGIELKKLEEVNKA